MALMNSSPRSMSPCRSQNAISGSIIQNSARHAAEFWMIEPEMAFCDLQGDMDLGEEFIKAMARYALEHCAEDLAFFSKFVDKGLSERLKFVVERPFVRVPYTEAIEILNKS